MSTKHTENTTVSRSAKDRRNVSICDQLWDMAKMEALRTKKPVGDVCERALRKLFRLKAA